MSFTDQKPFIAQPDHLRALWYGRKPGEYFRCGLCGDKFAVGDTVRWLYTNHIPGYGGNPFVCQPCDTPDVIDKWRAIKDEWHRVTSEDRFWYFRRHQNQSWSPSYP